MMNTCVKCHSSRGGHAYLGVASGTKPDVHLTKAGFDCMSCHKKDEIHGSGVKVEQRYAYDKLPKCQNCHPNIASSNTFHAVHGSDFNCQVCHSQDYNSCGSCHIGGVGARVTSYQDSLLSVEIWLHLTIGKNSDWLNIQVSMLIQLITILRRIIFNVKHQELM